MNQNGVPLQHKYNITLFNRSKPTEMLVYDMSKGSQVVCNHYGLLEQTPKARRECVGSLWLVRW